MTAIDSWKLLKSYHFVELWKTPTKYLVCYKYGGIFHFVNTFEEGVMKFALYETCEELKNDIMV